MGSLQVEFPLVFLRALMDVPLHSNITLQNAHLEGTGPCNFVAWKTEETVSMLLGGRDESLQLQPTEEGLCCRVSVMRGQEMTSCGESSGDSAEEEGEASDDCPESSVDDAAFKPFICPVPACEQIFETLPKVKDHLKKHRGKKINMNFLTHAINQIEEYQDCKQKLLILCPLCQMKLMPKHVPSHFAERHESEPDSQEAMLSCLYVRQQHRMLCKFTFKPDPKECPFCGEVFTTSPAVFRRHKNVECTQNPLYVRQCKDCESEPCIHTRGKNSVKAKRRRSSLVFQCPLCNYAMLSAEECSVHILDDHSAEERAHHCELCQRYFINSHALLTHRRIKHSETVVVKVFKCRVCCHSFDTREELNADMEAHAKEGLFICDICNKESTSFDTLRRHIQGVHKSKFPAYCEKCRSGIVNKKAVSLHRCASRFKHLINADETKLAELKKSEVRCDICQSVFRNLKVLNQHIRTIHEKRFPHHCDKCGAGLKTRAGLLQHRCSVRKGRPRKRKLEESDEEEEVDQCIFCGQDIASMDSYKDHMQYECPQNPQRRFKCSECSFESKSQKQFENHNCDEENMDRECEEDSDEAEEAETPANQCRKCGRVLRTVFALKHHSCRKESSLR